MADPIEPYGSIIARHLSDRGKRKDDFKWHERYKESRYVVRMCQELAEEIEATGGNPIDLETVLRAERTASGHIDYHQKAALYMDELARGVGPFVEKSDT